MKADALELEEPFLTAEERSWFDRRDWQEWADAWRMLGDSHRALAFDEEAVQLAPTDATAWADLAKLYALDGNTAGQQRAEKRAAELGSGNADISLKP